MGFIILQGDGEGKKMGREIFFEGGEEGGGCVRERQGDGEAGSGFRGGRV